MIDGRPSEVATPSWLQHRFHFAGFELRCPFVPSSGKEFVEPLCLCVNSQLSDDGVSDLVRSDSIATFKSHLVPIPTIRQGATEHDTGTCSRSGTTIQVTSSQLAGITNTAGELPSTEGMP